MQVFIIQEPLALCQICGYPLQAEFLVSSERVNAQMIDSTSYWKMKPNII